MNSKHTTTPWRYRGTLNAFLVLTACIQVVSAEPPAPPFFYDAAGKVPVTASNDEFVVQVRSGARIRDGSRPDFLPPRVFPDGMPAPLVRLEDHMERRGLYVVRGADATALRNLAQVEFVLPVLYRQGSDVPIYQTDRIIARVREGVAAHAVQELADSLGCDFAPRPRGANRFTFKIRDSAATNPLAVANTLHERADLLDYAHPDFILPKVPCSPPQIDDPFYLSHQWHLDGDVNKGAAADTDVNVETAWDTANGPTAQGSATVRVSVLDECVEKLHPDLFPNWAAGLDLDNDPPDDDPSPDAGQRHGTSCAGLAVAKGNNIGVRGACPDCGLIGVKFFGATIADTADGFYFSMDPNNDGDDSDGAAVMSNSWGYADGTLQPSDVVNAINTVASTGRNGKGCLVLFAAANNDHTVNGVSALAQLASVMAVGGTNSNNEHTEFSDVGPEVGIATPTNDRGDDGVRLSWLDITTTDNTGTSGYNGLDDLDYTDEFGGTSAATPTAAGILALIISQDETMTAAQARAILQHTAVRIDEPYGRFDGVTGHSHRYGFGRADAGQAILAALAGTRWPDRTRPPPAHASGNDVIVTWSTPPNNYAGTLVVRSNKPFAWMPQDGSSYAVNDVVAPGVTVVQNNATSIFTDAGASSGAFFYGVYPRSASDLYGFGAKAHIIRDGVTVFYDSSEGPDAGWTHGGAGDEWMRGTPTSANSIFGQLVTGSGPLAGTRGTRAIGGNRCWGTNLGSTYPPNANAFLETPVLNLTGVSVPVFLEYYDWCLLETFYDTCTVSVVDANGDFLGYLDADTGGDYDWTQRAYDLTPYAGQPIRVRFTLISDDLLERDGWFIDEVRVTVSANIALPPVANDAYAEMTENTSANVVLTGTDPNPGTTLSFVITALPQHGSLTDPGNATAIVSVPYTLTDNGNLVQYTPATDYQGPDSFTFEASDGALNSNTATARLSIGTPVLAYDFPLTINPGWITEGAWAYGIPQGSGGDPTSGFTGPNVYGYNLAGAYPNNLPPEHLTTLPLNCTGLSRVTVNFQRWLGVEDSIYDSASIQATKDGANWQTVWRHEGGDLQETSWNLQSHNFAAVADNEPFVQLRWVMGPTDGGVTFSGWNLDDIQITAIGTAQSNFPPLAHPVQIATARNTSVDIVLSAEDQNQDPIEFEIVELPTDGTLSDPNGSEIVAVPYTLLNMGNVVTYTPDLDFAGDDTFSFRATDGALSSNVAEARVTVLFPAVFPYVLDFETGEPLDVHWSTRSTVAGRIRVTDQDGPIGAYHLTMDSGREGEFSLNEMTLVVNLEGASNVLLRYDWKDFSEESNALPSSWQGSVNGDGVAISQDGLTWHLIANLFDTAAARNEGEGNEAESPMRADNYQTVTIDLDQAAADAGLSYNNTFRIRFQQYDNYPIPTDGVALDNISVLQGTPDPLIITELLPIGLVGQAYGPVAVTAAGGDPPLVWSNPVIYFDDGLGGNEFAEVGVAQGWNGDDVVFDYTLPFAFPFYDESHTAIKVGSDGWVNFAPHVGSTYNNSEVLLSFNKRIAVLWDDLRTDGGGDIYIDESAADRVTIRWDAMTTAGSAPCAFSATLFDDGRIQLNYGPGNNPVTATVGVSAGDQQRYTLLSYDGVPDLGNVDSLMVERSRLPTGLTMAADGTISGTPIAAGLFQPIFRVVDASAREDSKTIPMSVFVSVPGDLDGNGVVNLVDFATFSTCFGLTEPNETCDADELAGSDMNGDGIVDLVDFASFALVFGT